jgi:hypothetical protein
MWVVSTYDFYSLPVPLEQMGPRIQTSQGTCNVQGPPTKPAETVSRARGFKTFVSSESRLWSSFDRSEVHLGSIPTGNV